MSELKSVVKTRNIRPESVGITMADNASNITRAFELDDILVQENNTVSDDDTDDGVSDTDPCDLDFNDSEDSSENEGRNSQNSDEEYEESSDDGEEQMSGAPHTTFSTDEVDYVNIPWRRLRCCAHTIQLAINDAVKSNPNIKELIVYMDHIIRTFKRSPKKTEELRSKGIKKALIKHGTTRWNSILFAAERLIEVRNHRKTYWVNQ